MPLELAAVIVPSALNAGFSDAMRSSFARRGGSSSRTVVPFASMGATSRVSAPASIAARARSTERIA